MKPGLSSSDWKSFLEFIRSTEFKVPPCICAYLDQLGTVTTSTLTPVINSLPVHTADAATDDNNFAVYKASWGPYLVANANYPFYRTRLCPRILLTLIRDKIDDDFLGTAAVNILYGFTILNSLLILGRQISVKFWIG